MSNFQSTENSYQWSASEIDHLLRDRVGELVEHVSGQQGIRHGNELRIGNKGGLKADIAGNSKGRITPFDGEGKGMSPFQYIQSEMCCSFPEALEWAANWLGMSPDYKPDPEAEHRRKKERRAREEKAAIEKASLLKWVLKIWGETESARGTPVSIYLTSRGITECPSTIRYHRALKHTNTGQYFGCMVAAITHWPDRNVIGIHRTYLQPGGRSKANVTSSKKMAGDCKGGAVRLAPVTDMLGLTEGIETGLSVQQSTGIPTWACLSTSGLRGVIVPDTVREILIFADGDEPGEKAACLAARRFIEQGKKTKIIRAPKGQDFNDVLKESANG